MGRKSQLIDALFDVHELIELGLRNDVNHLPQLRPLFEYIQGDSEQAAPNAQTKALFDEGASKISHCIARFYCREAGNSKKMECVGTGFIADVGGRPCLVTAKHVLDTYDAQDPIGIQLGPENRWMLFSKKRYFAETRLDVAWMEIDSNFFPEGTTTNHTIRRLDLRTKSDDVLWKATSSFSIFGFPTFLNRHDLRNSRRSPHPFSYISHSAIVQEDSRRLFLPYLNLAVNGFAGQNENVLVEPEGFSGAPALQWFFDKANLTIRYRVAGVVTSWNKRLGHLIASTIGDPIVG